MAPSAKFFPQLMDDPFGWRQTAQLPVHPLIFSSVFHYEFVIIHPFSDGNGRMAQLLHTAILSKQTPIFEYVPIESQIGRFQEDYYIAIARYHIDGEATAFHVFILSQIDKILDDISVQISKDNAQLSAYVKRLLNALAALMEKLVLKSNENFRRNYLHPAINLNPIHMAIPDKPNSRNLR